MGQDKAWACYNALKNVLASMKGMEQTTYYANVSAAVSSAKDYLVAQLQGSGNT